MLGNHVGPHVLCSVFEMKTGSESTERAQASSPVESSRVRDEAVLLPKSASSAAMINYLAGVGGGVSVVLFGHPFDTTKTRMQTAPPGYYGGTWDVVSKTLKEEGAGGFYAGVMSPLLGQMFFRAASFMTFYATVRALNGGNEGGTTTTRSIVAAGSVTGFIISFIETPIDLVKTKLQIQVFGSSHGNVSRPPLYSTLSGCVQHILRTHGARGLMQGWGSTAIRNVPANAMFFPVNELAKQKFAEMDNVPVSEVSVGKKLISGATAGVCYWTLTYPLDAIKGRAMAAPFKKRKSWIGIVKSMAFRDFFTGIVPCTARAAVACSAMFYTVDMIRLKLGGGR